jgi:hypothetical protein
VDEDYGWLIDGMRWSFSRLNSFYENCRHEWKEVYINCADKDQNFFAEYGSFIHELLEGYCKGDISIFELSQVYEDGFVEAIPHDAPPNKYVDIKQSYYDKGLDYLDNIDLDLENYEVLGVEKKVEFEIDGKPFVGFIDLLLKNKKDGKITILDHKSASIKILKNGNISKSDQEHFLSFKRQLYLYSLPIIEEYGEVDYLEWNMFKDRKHIKIDWNKEDYEEAIKWASNTIKLIEKEKEWNPNPDFFYCNYLCSQRNNCCPYKPTPIPKEKTIDEEYYNPEEG